MSDGENPPEEIGWRFEVDPTAGELRLEHAESDTIYVLDAEGGLRVPGDAGGDLDALRETLASVLRSDGGDYEAVTDGGQSAGNCTVECDETTGEVIIESDSKISLDAPTIELSSATTTVDASGVLTLQGGVIKLN
jgi:hypothetical protein